VEAVRPGVIWARHDGDLGQDKGVGWWVSVAAQRATTPNTLK
jgi:hypothetical protein